MVYTEQNTKFIDKDGLIYLINQLREDIDNIDASNVDLSNYVTNEQLQEALRNAGVDIDLSTYATKEELLEAINSIDLSSYALKTEIPSIDGLATTEYVDNAIANVPSGGNVDLSNYYTKDETYSKTEVDTAISNIEGGNTSSDSCALYDTVVANGGAVKEIIETEKPVGTNLSEIISDVANGKEVIGDGNGHFYVRMNPDKTQEELNAEFNGANSTHDRLDFILASSIKPEELFASNIKERLKNGEEIYYIFAHKVNGNYNFFYAKVFYGYGDNSHPNVYCTQIHQIVNNARFNIYEQMKNIKYLCSGTYCNGGQTLNKDTGYFVFHSDYHPSGWRFFSKYIPTGTEYLYSIGDGNTYTLSENISSPEFSAHLLDTYLSNCNETIKISEAVNYTLAEWGEKLDTQGEDGVSPTVSITETDNGHTVSITDVNGTQSFDMTNGVSPTVTVTKEGKVATITCTDANGTTTATISDGADGQGGGSSSGGSSGGASNVYSTGETAIGTWIDGKTIYRKVIEYGKLASLSSSGGHGKATVNFEEAFGMVIKMTALLASSNGNVHQIVDATSDQVILVPSTSISTYVKQVEDYKAYINSATNTSVTLWYGKEYGGYNCTFIVEYTKSA